QAFLDDIANVFNPTVLNPLIDQMMSGIGSANVAAMKTFVVNRTNAVLSQIPRSFAITSPTPVAGSYPASTNGLAAVAGTANAAATRSVMVNGQLVAYNAQTGAWSTTSGGTGGTITLLQAGTQGTQGTGTPCTGGTPGTAGA